ncbi:alpha/beta hydrolase [Pseudoalteromonas xiamenensis]|uniref:Alpha/beta hydrolase n=1 Tax=Pseudoalteromonas xiamenensis TaxID=882626 RepID=A0A975DGU8_9GAMM|nr:alpha/beta hydrolase [Pseudoalteromonas xiamenensis]QTH71314.1 alpha/beta hydrolase [Pseudoalteromonas xiamenensis]
MSKFLESGIQKLVDEFQAIGKPCPSKSSIHERRAGYLASTVLAGECHGAIEKHTDVANGIPITVYRPVHGETLPIVIYFHGGCFISGGTETHEMQLRQIATEAHAIVVCISYRLAPEFTYPAAHDDVFHAVRGIMQQGCIVGGDVANVIFAGDSAGGHLALATALRLKRNNFAQPRKLVLIYPMLDPFGRSESYRQFGEDFVITAQMLLSGFSLYAGNGASQKTLAELNLVEAMDYSGLPATYIFTAEFDPLRDEGEALYRDLLRHGVDAYCERYLGVIHGFFQLSGISETARRCIKNIADIVVS